MKGRGRSAHRNYHIGRLRSGRLSDFTLLGSVVLKLYNIFIITGPEYRLVLV